MRFPLRVTSIVVPKNSQDVIIGLDMGQPGCYGELTLAPVQAQQLAHDLLGAVAVAQGHIDGPGLVTPDLLAVSVCDTVNTPPKYQVSGQGRQHRLELDTIRYRTKAGESR
jgi:hypothetical protein